MSSVMPQLIENPFGFSHLGWTLKPGATVVPATTLLWPIVFPAVRSAGRNSLKKPKSLPFFPRARRMSAILRQIQHKWQRPPIKNRARILDEKPLSNFLPVLRRHLRVGFLQLQRARSNIVRVAGEKMHRAILQP